MGLNIETSKKTKSNNNMSWLGAGLGAVGSAIGMIGQRARERRTNKQNEKLMDIQHGNQKELNKQGQQLSMDMWNKTNYGAQMEHMKEAGVNPALMYGQGGGGGTTANSGSGGSAAMGSAAQPQMMDISALDGMMKMAQVELMKQQGKKLEAEADNLNETGRSTYLDNMIKKYGMGQGDEGEAQRSKRYGEGTVHIDSKIAKQVESEIGLAEENLRKAKNNNDIGEAEIVIKQFEADLAKEGISSGSPYYIKLLTDVLRKTGILEMIKGE